MSERQRLPVESLHSLEARRAAFHLGKLARCADGVPVGIADTQRVAAELRNVVAAIILNAAHAADEYAAEGASLQASTIGACLADITDATKRLSALANALEGRAP